VYALGFYVDEAAARDALGPKFSRVESSAAANDQSLCDGELLPSCASCYISWHASPGQLRVGWSLPRPCCKVQADSGSLGAEVVNSREIEKTVRIVITSGMVNHDRFLGSLKESLVPACEKVPTTSTTHPSHWQAFGFAAHDQETCVCPRTQLAEFRALITTAASQPLPHNHLCVFCCT
jgi:hypothetical protein